MRNLEGKTSAELREQCLELYFRPIAQAILARSPATHSVALTVGQYWCDEAEDAVHLEILPFAERDPRWPPPDDCAEQAFEFLEPLLAADGGYWKFSSSLPQLDDNGNAITAFASCCKEGCDQEMPIGESHLIYAIARRSDDGSTQIDIVGRMLRPEWEDRFDVGFELEGDQAVDRPVTRPAPPPAGGLFARLRGLFRRGG